MQPDADSHCGTPGHTFYIHFSSERAVNVVDQCSQCGRTSAV